MEVNKTIKLNSNQSIVLQGSTQYGFEEICNFYKQFDNVVWSTWEDEPISNLKKIEESGIKLILNKKPSFPGYLNVNLQFYSTLSAINYLKKQKNINEIIKVRSDVLIFGVERLLNKLKGKDISFMAYFNMQHPEYYLQNQYHHSMDFPIDFVIFGSIDTMYDIFNFQMEYLSAIPPEAIILRNYLLAKSFVYNTNYDYIKSIGVDFFMRYEKECDLYLYWLKHNREDLGNRFRNNPNEYLYN